MGATTAERQARHRERQATAQGEALAQGRAILATLEAITRTLDDLTTEVRALRNGGGKPARNGGKPRPVVASVTSQPAPAEGAFARAREDGASPPTGGVGALYLERDGRAVLDTLAAGRGSAGAIRDALGAMGRDLSLDRITAALVDLQARHLVRRVTGEGRRPDTWEAVPVDPALEELVDPPLRHPGPDPQATAHVDCQDYRAHGAAHRWDPALGRFRCHVCAPDTPAHGALAVHPGQGVTPSPGGH